MNDPIATALRDLFAEEADRAPTADADLARKTRRRVRRRRTTFTVGAATLLAAATTVSVALTPDHSTPATPRAGTSGPTAAPTHPAGQTRHGGLPGSGLASCAASYTIATLRQRAFAFDGTVIRIGEPITNLPGRAPLPLAGVTFSVNHWYRGGTAHDVTVDLAPPNTEQEPSYSTGTRLLVTGEPRWGGTPLNNPIAWACGFTRYWDPATAEVWRRSL